MRKLANKVAARLARSVICRYLAGWPKTLFQMYGSPILGRAGDRGRNSATPEICRPIWKPLCGSWAPGGIYSQALGRRSQPGPKGPSHLHSTGDVKLPTSVGASARALLTSAYREGQINPA